MTTLENLLTPLTVMTPTTPQPPPLPSGWRDTLSSPWFRTLQLVVLIAQASVGIAVIAKSSAPKSWTPDTGSVTKPPQHKLTVMDRGHPTEVNLISNPAFLPELELTVDGKPARFLVDTGSTHVCLLGNAMETLGLRADAVFHTDVYTARGRHDSLTGYVKSATFGIGDETTVQIDNVLVLPGDAQSSYQGLLSGAFLQAIGAVIDFRDGTMRIGRGGKNAIQEPGDGAKPTHDVQLQTK
jgi:predicted aspartyl protease